MMMEREKNNKGKTIKRNGNVMIIHDLSTGLRECHDSGFF